MVLTTYSLTTYSPRFSSLEAHNYVKTSVLTKSEFNSTNFVELIRATDCGFVAIERCAEKAFSKFFVKIRACITECTSVTHM